MKTTEVNKRKLKDIMSLAQSKYTVIREGDKFDEFTVVFRGPKGSEYEGVNIVW